MIKVIKRLVRKLFTLIGFDLIRISRSPGHTFLGLKKLSIHTIIDIGANEGQFAQKMLKWFPQATIYSFEPLPGPFNELRKWAEGQNGKVKAFRLAIGDWEGHTEIYHHLEHSPSSSLLKSTDICGTFYPFTKKQTLISVRSTTLDKVMAGFAKYLIPDILIKVDVQGYEDRVIKGGTETLHKAKACILEVSLDQLYEKQASFADILILLSDLGFHYVGNLEQTCADDGHVIYVDSVFTK